MFCRKIEALTRTTYSGKGVLQEYHWAYILPLAASLHLHNNNQANLPIYGFEADPQILLLPETKQVLANGHISL